MYANWRHCLAACMPWKRRQFNGKKERKKELIGWNRLNSRAQAKEIPYVRTFNCLCPSTFHICLTKCNGNIIYIYIVKLVRLDVFPLICIQIDTLYRNQWNSIHINVICLWHGKPRIPSDWIRIFPSYFRFVWHLRMHILFK